MALVADVLTIEGLIDVGIKARDRIGSGRVLLLVVARLQRHPRCRALQHVARRSLCIARPLFGLQSCGVMSEGEQSSLSQPLSAAACAVAAGVGFVGGARHHREVRHRPTRLCNRTNARRRRRPAPLGPGQMWLGCGQGDRPAISAVHIAAAACTSDGVHRCARRGAAPTYARSHLGTIPLTPAPT
jgi:hypothetical protein